MAHYQSWLNCTNIHQYQILRSLWQVWGYTTGTHLTTLLWSIFIGTHHSNCFKIWSGRYQLERSQPPHHGSCLGYLPWRSNRCSHSSSQWHLQPGSWNQWWGIWRQAPDKWTLRLENYKINVNTYNETDWFTWEEVNGNLVKLSQARGNHDWDERVQGGYEREYAPHLRFGHNLWDHRADNDKGGCAHCANRQAFENRHLVRCY